ncbi:phosphotransferase [Cupriavidus sp. WKF15]|uniref:phosphotransferase n=1 Tax=Cupriavidus sp. WKF15 TaxID=3032282 RepID=UPI0023E0C3F1|nr:phosphotransferase [Cupriavidus sp. WKF15]WER50775.1 phosphotransferase [Cupriavidus sp. WKF15]
MTERKDAHMYPPTTSRLNEASLFEWMKTNVADFSGPMQVTQFSTGQSNPTYRIQTPARDYVLRRKPPGEGLLKGAHAVDREARVMKALEQVGYPVPLVYGLCTDESVIGSWFYVMNLVDGRIFWDASFPEIDKAERPEYMDAMNATLASLHRVDYMSIGLQDFGRPDNYILRQVGRWSKQYQSDELAGRHHAMDSLVDWLPAHVPTVDDAAVLHGDFRVDNMIFHPKEPRVIAVLDWELSTLGDPLADFAYHVMMYRMPRDILGGIAGVDLAHAGLPDEQAYVRAYCDRTSRSEIRDLNFYIAFNMFRFAAILHGIKGRAARGTATNADAGKVGSTFSRVAELAWEQARRVT